MNYISAHLVSGHERTLLFPLGKGFSRRLCADGHEELTWLPSPPLYCSAMQQPRPQGNVASAPDSTGALGGSKDTGCLVRPLAHYPSLPGSCELQYSWCTQFCRAWGPRSLHCQCVTHDFLSCLKPIFFRPSSPTELSLQGLADTKIPRSGTPVSIRSNRSLSVLRIPSQSQVSQICSQGTLHRSVSQLMDIQDKKVLIDDSLWEAIMGHDSGLVSHFLTPSLC